MTIAEAILEWSQGARSFESLLGFADQFLRAKGYQWPDDAPRRFRMLDLEGGSMQAEVVDGGEFFIDKAVILDPERARVMTALLLEVQEQYAAEAADAVSEALLLLGLADAGPR